MSGTLNTTIPVVVKKRKTRQWMEARRAYFFFIPLIFYTSLWSLIPLLYAFYLGFTEYNGLGRSPVFVGLKNFETLFMLPDFTILLVRQMIFGFVCLVSGTICSFIFALLLNIRSRIKGFFRSALYIPSLAASTATAGIWVALLNPGNRQGINYLISLLGGTPVPWNYSPMWMFFWIIMYNIWKGVGPGAILWLGGLQGIDPSLYEAAKVDGATFPQQIRHITIPGLRYITMYVLLTGIIGAMQMFDQVMFISGGNPYGQTDVLMYKIYRDGFRNFNLGMAGAESLILGFVIIIFAFMYFNVQWKRLEK
jgi:ABC-type sugar transport system permease subunit